MDALAKTNEEWIAYKYDAGLKGFTTALTPRVTWRDTGGHPQVHQFGGVVNTTLARVKAQNRVMVAEGPAGSIATFTPPHTFFFTREKDTNLGFAWYRKDADGKFGMGVGMPEREEEAQYVENFALYNAPPGTVQHMGMYFYASPDAGEPTREAVMAFTHDDTFKAVAGYKTFVNHFHLDFTGRQRASGSLDTPSQDLAAMKTLGLNIIGLSDFHFELHPNDPGPLRFADEKDYFAATRLASDTDFLVTPWEEPSAYYGGHYNIMFPKRVYWSKVRQPGQPFTETDPTYGKVYHTGNAEDVQKMMDLEGAYWYHAHPRTKGTTGFPDLIFDKPWVKNDKYLGIAFKPGMGQDQSEARLCEWRCFDAVDTMNNLYGEYGAPAEVHLRGHRHLPEGSGRRHLCQLPGQLPEDRQGAGAGRGLEPDSQVAARRRLLRDDRRNPHQELQRVGERHEADDQRRRRVDLPVVVRGSRVGRRQEDRSPDHLGDRSRRVRNEEVRHSIRRDRQDVGEVCGVGFGRRRRLRSTCLADAAEADHGRWKVGAMTKHILHGRPGWLSANRVRGTLGSALCTAMLALFLASPAFAQGSAASGVISGTIKDESGGALPGVTATLTSPALQVRQVVAVSDSEGNYRFGELPVGTFRVMYELQGFTAFIRDDLRLPIGFSAKVDVVMKVGTVSETVTVSGASPVIDVSSTSTSVSFTKETLNEIPRGQDLSMIYSMAPGVTLAGTPDVGGSNMANRQNISAGGVALQPRLLFEGLNIVLSDDQNSGVYFNSDSLEETTIRTSGNDAEVMTPGISMVAVVKSGGNNFHGLFKVEDEPPALQSNNLDDHLRSQGLTAVQPIKSFYNWQGDIGGRLLRDKLWFYDGYSTQQKNTGIAGFVTNAGPGWRLPHGR